MPPPRVPTCMAGPCPSSPTLYPDARSTLCRQTGPEAPHLSLCVRKGAPPCILLHPFVCLHVLLLIVSTHLSLPEQIGMLACNHSLSLTLIALIALSLLRVRLLYACCVAVAHYSLWFCHLRPAVAGAPLAWRQLQRTAAAPHFSCAEPALECPGAPYLTCYSLRSMFMVP